MLPVFTTPLLGKRILVVLVVLFAFVQFHQSRLLCLAPKVLLVLPNVPIELSHFSFSSGESLSLPSGSVGIIHRLQYIVLKSSSIVIARSGGGYPVAVGLLGLNLPSRWSYHIVQSAPSRVESSVDTVFFLVSFRFVQVSCRVAAESL